MSREQLAAATRISVRQVEALETGRLEVLPAKVFSRGFVRAIAVHLGLDAEAWAAAFGAVWETWTAEEMSRSARELEVSGRHVRLSRPRRVASVSNLAIGFGIAFAVALVTLGAALFKSDRPGKRSQARPRAERTAVETGPASLALPPAIAASAVALPPETPAATPAPAPRERGPAAAAQAAPQGLKLVLSFRDDCWTEVSVDGKPAAAELFRKGTVKEFQGTSKFVLTLGNAEAVAVSLNGNPVAMSTSLGRVIKNLVLDLAASRPRPANG